MADIKWIKITTDMFDDEKIDFISSLPEGDSLIVVWIRLLTMAGKNNAGGYIFLTENIPFTEDMLAHKFRKSINVIKLALETFERLGMISFDEAGKIMITNWCKHQNIEGMDKVRELTRERVAKHRQLKAVEIHSIPCQYCGGESTGYDHIIATARGGKDIESNKIPCCIDCNRMKNDKPVVDFLNNNRDRINDELIAKNKKLKRYVTLSNVTGRYEVTESNAIELDSDSEKELEKESNSKKNKIPKRKYSEFVRLTEMEYNRFVDEFGETGAKRLIEILDNYKGANGKKYADDNRAIRNWVIDRYKEETKHQEKGGNWIVGH